MKEVAGKTALITGGARGLGAAMAQMLGAEGARVVITDVRAKEGEEQVKALKASGIDASFVRHDVTDEAQWASAVAAAGRIDVLVNNAGIAGAGSALEETTLAEWRQVMEINLDGVFLGVKHGVRAMKEHGGSIINISSIMGLIGFARSSAYNASKGGVRLLTKCAAIECAQLGYKIRVNSIHPGFVETDLVRDAVGAGVQKGNFPSYAEAETLLRSLHPIGRLGLPVEIANAVLFLASERSSWMTGAELVVDGGYTAQ